MPRLALWSMSAWLAVQAAFAAWSMTESFIVVAVAVLFAVWSVYTLFAD